MGHLGNLDQIKMELHNTVMNEMKPEPEKDETPLIEYEEIEGTPFTIVHQNNMWFLVMGNNRITEPTHTRLEQINKLDSEKFLLMLHIAVIVGEKLKNDIQIIN